MLWDQSVDFGLAGLSGSSHPGAYPDGSSAWFMPFNLAPPEVSQEAEIGGFPDGTGDGGVYGKGRNLGH